MSVTRSGLPSVNSTACPGWSASIGPPTSASASSAVSSLEGGRCRSAPPGRTSRRHDGVGGGLPRPQRGDERQAALGDGDLQEGRGGEVEGVEVVGHEHRPAGPRRRHQAVDAGPEDERPPVGVAGQRRGAGRRRRRRAGGGWGRRAPGRAPSPRPSATRRPGRGGGSFPPREAGDNLAPPALEAGDRTERAGELAGTAPCGRADPRVGAARPDVSGVREGAGTAAGGGQARPAV